MEVLSRGWILPKIPETNKSFSLQGIILRNLVVRIFKSFIDRIGSKGYREGNDHYGNSQTMKITKTEYTFERNEKELEPGIWKLYFLCLQYLGIGIDHFNCQYGREKSNPFTAFTRF